MHNSIYVSVLHRSKTTFKTKTNDEIIANTKLLVDKSIQ